MKGKELKTYLYVPQENFSYMILLNSDPTCFVHTVGFQKYRAPEGPLPVPVPHCSVHFLHAMPLHFYPLICNKIEVLFISTEKRRIKQGYKTEVHF